MVFSHVFQGFSNTRVYARTFKQVPRINILCKMFTKGVYWHVGHEALKGTPGPPPAAASSSQLLLLRNPAYEGSWIMAWPYWLLTSMVMGLEVVLVVSSCVSFHTAANTTLHHQQHNDSANAQAVPPSFSTWRLIQARVRWSNAQRPKVLKHIL